MENVIATIIFFVLMVGIIGLVVYKMKKTKPDITIEEFIEIYYDNLIDVLKDSVRIISVEPSQYNDREKYLKAIINLTIEALNNNCEEFGIDNTLFKLFNYEQLTDFLYDILTRNNIFIFGDSVSADDANANPILYTEVEMNAISSKENG